MDDNPAERALVRRFAPEVAVPDMPEDPAGYIQALAAHRYFETVAFTREDSARARYYAENAQRRELSARVFGHRHVPGLAVDADAGRAGGEL